MEKPFSGHDAMANYFIIGAKQLGVGSFSLKDGKLCSLWIRMS